MSAVTEKFEVAGWSLSITCDHGVEARVQRVYDSIDPPLTVKQSLPASAIEVDEMRSTAPGAPCAAETVQYRFDSLAATDQIRVLKFSAASPFKPKIVTTAVSYSIGGVSVEGHVVHRITLLVDARWREPATP